MSFLPFWKDFQFPCRSCCLWGLLGKRTVKEMWFLVCALVGGSLGPWVLCVCFSGRIKLQVRLICLETPKRLIVTTIMSLAKTRRIQATGHWRPLAVDQCHQELEWQPRPPTLEVGADLDDLWYRLLLAGPTLSRF
jgi:hypothetical protein